MDRGRGNTFANLGNYRCKIDSIPGPALENGRCVGEESDGGMNASYKTKSLQNASSPHYAEIHPGSIQRIFESITDEKTEEYIFPDLSPESSVPHSSVEQFVANGGRRTSPVPLEVERDVDPSIKKEVKREMEDSANVEEEWKGSTAHVVDAEDIEPAPSEVLSASVLSPIHIKLVCSICGTNFSSQWKLEKHVRKHVEGKPSFRCNIYGRTFKKPSNLERHRRNHADEKPFKCSICGRSFSRADDVKIHRRRHLGEKPFECAVCFRRFVKKGELTNHYRTHSGERPFLCSNCHKTFPTSSALRRHERSHTGEKPFECTICKKRFTRFQYAQKHGQIHRARGRKSDSCGVVVKQQGDSSNSQSLEIVLQSKECLYCGRPHMFPLIMQENVQLETGKFWSSSGNFWSSAGFAGNMV
ncbi:unnamed protein product [Cyprideis torosa]|uniref:Uncharacterized protein n=1 Tax=Cyprideis torosa TaxID=163714 RepID=A0A7R8WHA2_9CRUS|nr:unnamed protein product [Cyprideis torosa]CAG0893590.1 unnamed protein product [Cyprideis torosa]